MKLINFRIFFYVLGSMFCLTQFSLAMYGEPPIFESLDPVIGDPIEWRENILTEDSDQHQAPFLNPQSYQAIYEGDNQQSAVVTVNVPEPLPTPHPQQPKQLRFYPAKIPKQQINSVHHIDRVPKDVQFSFQDDTPIRTNDGFKCPVCKREFPGQEKYWSHIKTCTPEESPPQYIDRPARNTANSTSSARTRSLIPPPVNHVYHEPPPIQQPQLQPVTCRWQEPGGTMCNFVFLTGAELAAHVREFHTRTCKFPIYAQNQWQLCNEGPFASQAALLNHITRMHTGTN